MNKLENTPENKEKFFGLYLRQKVLQYKEEIETPPVDVFQYFNPYRGSVDGGSFYLELTPLSQISDENSIIVFDMLFSNDANRNKCREFKIDFGKDWASSVNCERYGLIPFGYLNSLDFLRSKGYALPFMGLSVEDLVEYGWVKLKTKNSYESSI